MERVNIERTKAVSRSIGNNTGVVVDRIEEFPPTSDEVCLHEAWHVVFSPRIKFATVIPSGNALGIMVPEILTPEAVAAPAALNYPGTWHDRNVAKVLGVDWDISQSAVKAGSAGKKELAKKVAAMLKVEGTIYQKDYEKAKKEVADEKNGIYPVRVTIYKAGNAKESFITKSSHGEVIIPKFISRN